MEERTNLLHGDITDKILHAAFKVHNYLGNGFQEVINQRALELEFLEMGLLFGREVSVMLYYRNFERPIGTRRADFIVEEKVLVETKAITHQDDICMAQVLNYLQAYKLEVALLINFGKPKLEFKRLIRSMSTT